MKLYMLWFFLLAVTAFIFQRDAGLRYGHNEMCTKLKNDFVEKITPQDFKQCLNLYDEALTFQSWESKTNAWLGLWGWSHLSVYSPRESTEIWESKTENIGAKIKAIENKLLVYRAHSKSVFKKGDVFLEVNGEKPVYASDVLNESGLFKIIRDGDEKSFKVKTEEFVWDDKVEFKVEKSKAVIKVPSFRGEFFEDTELKKMSDQINSIENETVHLDLRDNIGGNIASALRLLSLFICDGAVVGSFKIPSREDLGVSDYPLTVDQSVQVEHMKKYGEVQLKVPRNSSCSEKTVKVLVNSQTASTAELVAQAFIDLDRGVVIGENTSGRMVLSSWEPIVYFPKGFYFSHPYALYKSKSGLRIEGSGVAPQVYKTYVLALEVSGVDSFLN